MRVDGLITRFWDELLLNGWNSDFLPLVTLIRRTLGEAIAYQYMM